MSNISDLIIKMRADAADVQTGFDRASASLDHFINKLKTPQVLKVSVITSFATVGGATAAAKVGQMLYDQAEAAEAASSAVDKYSQTISKEMTGAYDAISAVTQKSATNLSNMTQAIFRDSANATASYSDYMSDLIERNAGSWYDFSEKVGTAVGWITKSILSAGATMAWLLESSTIILDDLWAQWLGVWENMKAPVTRLYEWAVEKLGWILDAVKWIMDAVNLTGPSASAILSPEAQKRLGTSLEALKKGVADIWTAQGRSPHAKPAGAPGAAGRPDRYIDTEEAYLKTLREQVKFYDGVSAGLRQMRDDKLAIIDADQKMLDIERLVSLSEEDYLAATLGNLERKVQAQRDMIQARLSWSNVIEAREYEELDRQEKLLAVQRRRVEVEERLRKDPMAGTVKALGDLSKHYQSTGKLMEDFTIQTFMRMEDAFVAFCDTGKFEFKDFVRQTLIQLNRLFFQITVLEPMADRLRVAMQSIGSGGFGGGGGFGGFGGLGNLFGSLGGLFGGGAAAMEGLAISSSFLEGLGAFSMFLVGKGAAFDNGRALRRYARGGIVHAPTVFPMASGMGLMGEAGPEAVIPLKRTASGDLGVQAGGGGPLVGAIHIHAADAQSFYDMCRRNPAAITDPVERALQGNQSIRRTIMRTAK